MGVNIESGSTDSSSIRFLFTVQLSQPSCIYKNGHNFATGLPIDVLFGSRVGFSGMAKLMVQLSNFKNPRWWYTCTAVARNPCISWAFLFTFMQSMNCVCVCKGRSINPTKNGKWTLASAVAFTYCYCSTWMTLADPVFIRVSVCLCATARKIVAACTFVVRLIEIYGGLMRFVWF